VASTTKTAMRRIILLFGLGLALGATTFAQEFEHVQIGVFANYLQVSQANSDFAGFGGRVGVAAWRNVMLEGELCYDFDTTVLGEFEEIFNGNVSKLPIDLWMLHGEFGPRVNLGRHRVHAFVFIKGGFIDYRFGHVPTSLGSLETTLRNLQSSGVHAVFYPGGGLEGHIRHLGLRLNVGDEMDFSGGVHNNLRVDFGPFIRF
jgi:hypothetical protein